MNFRIFGNRIAGLTIFVACSILATCASNSNAFAQESKSIGERFPVEKLRPVRLELQPSVPFNRALYEGKLVDGAEYESRSGKLGESGEYYAHIVKRDGKWTASSISTDFPSLVDLDGEEVLAISSDFKKIRPAFRDWQIDASLFTKKIKPVDYYSCHVGGLAALSKAGRNGYNPCDSSLTSSASAGAAITETMMAAATLGISAAIGVTLDYVVDPVKVVALIEESQLIEKELPAFQRKLWVADYQDTFKGIKTVSSADKFIGQYATDDPESLVPKAKAIRDSLEPFEAEQRRISESKAAEQRRVREIKVEEKRQADLREYERHRLVQEKMLVQRNTLTAEFRKTIQIGSDTFCGPVIAIRGPMIQIASSVPLPGYSPEPWLKLGDIYPASVAGCENVNGRLSPIF